MVNILKILHVSQGIPMSLIRLTEPYFYELFIAQIKNVIRWLCESKKRMHLRTTKEENTYLDRWKSFSQVQGQEESSLNKTFDMTLLEVQ